MKTHKVAIGTVVWLCLLTTMACGGDDDTSPAADAGPDGGEQGGSGGRSGRGGSGGSGGTAAKGGSGGESNQSGGAGGSHPGDGTKYKVSGDLSGLSGSGIVLKLNGGSELSPTDNGTFTFDAELDSGADYEVTVGTQPHDPAQTCTVSDGKGKIDQADVTNVKVSCTGEPHKIGGTLTGVAGGTVVIKNGDDTLSLSADGAFSFANKVGSGASYAVSVQTNPSGKTCGVDHASGTVGSSDVTDVAVACYADLSLVAMPRPGSVGLRWNNNGASSYSVLVSTAANCNFDNLGSCANGSQQANVTSPYVFSGLTDGTVYYFQLRATYAGGLQTHSNTSGVRPNRPQFDKAANTTALGSSGVVYVGGAFSSVGAFTGSTIPLDATTGAPTRIPNFPTINGGVAAIVSDGNNGFFIGGSFSSVGDVERSGLAHVTSDGTVDATWNPNVTGEVVAMALSGTTLYLGGTFTKLGDTDTRSGLGAVSTTGAGAATPWNPTMMMGTDGAVTVGALAVSGGTLYVGGDFMMINASSRGYLAAFDISTTPGTPTLKNNWDPNATGPNGVRALIVAGDTVYASGYFNKIGNADHIGLAAIDASGAANAFQPDPNGLVRGLAVVDDKIFVAGEFSSIGGKARKQLALLTTSDGVAVDGWTPEPDGTVVNALAVSGDSVYVGGDFTVIGSPATPRAHLAALDRATAAAKALDPRPSDVISVIAVAGDTVYVSGDDVRTISAEPRARLASFNGSSLTTWAPNISGGDVYALAYSGTTVFAGGEFDSVGSSMRQGVAAIDGNGAATSWDAHLAAGGLVYALALDDNRVYIGGSFGPTSTHSNLLGVSKTDGSMMVWNAPSPDDVVRALAFGDSTLYVGGEFANLGATGRQHLAAIDNAGALVPAWNPGANNTVNALVVGGDNVFVGGALTQLGGQTRNRLGAVGKDGNLAAFDPNLDGEVTSLAFASGNLYAGGQFTQIGTGVGADSRSGVAEWDSTLTVTPWSRNVVGNVFSINVTSDASSRYVAGDFFRVGQDPASDFYVAKPDP